MTEIKDVRGLMKIQITIAIVKGKKYFMVMFVCIFPCVPSTEFEDLSKTSFIVEFEDLSKPPLLLSLRIYVNLLLVSLRISQNLNVYLV